MNGKIKLHLPVTVLKKLDADTEAKESTLCHNYFAQNIIQ